MKRIIAVMAAGCLMASPAVRADNAASTEAAKAPASWADRVTIKGDVRYRIENVDDQSKTAEQQRDRVRLRLGAYGKANDEVDVGPQLTSTSTDSPGNGDPISGNQTLGSSGSRKAAYFDLGYIDYHPEDVEGLHAVGGKMKNPFIAVDDNIWDCDYNPEGLALKYQAGEDVQLLAAADYTWLEERAASSSDGKQYGAQVGVKFNVDQKNYALVGGSYYGTDNLKGNPVLDNQGKSRAFGNSTENLVVGNVTNIVYANEFSVLEGFAEAGFDAGVPVRVYGSYTVNNDADSDDTGYLAGFAVSKAKDPGSLEVGYNYRDLEKNAVLAAVTDSDSGGGGTNHKGHKVYAKYQIAKNFQLGATYFMDQKDPDGKDTDYNRFQFDVSASF